MAGPDAQAIEQPSNVIGLFERRAKAIAELANQSRFEWSYLTEDVARSLAAIGASDDEVWDVLWRCMFSMFIDYAERNAVRLALARRKRVLEDEPADHCDVVSLARYRKRRRKPTAAKGVSRRPTTTPTPGHAA